MAQNAMKCAATWKTVWIRYEESGSPPKFT